MKYFRSRQYPIELVISEDINKEFSSHNHANHYIISLCIKGSVTAILKDKVMHLEENDCFVVPPFMPHAVRLTKTSTLVSLCMDKSFVEEYSPKNGTEILKTILLSKKIQQQITKSQTELLLQTIPYLYELHFTHREVNNPAAMEDDMSILCDKLTNNLSDSIALDHLARDLYINKYYLIRKCKRYLGLTPHKFHLQSRIRKAQNMLFTGQSITEASVNTGFYDQSHFDKSFKKIVGISPTEYLRNCLEITCD